MRTGLETRPSEVLSVALAAAVALGTAGAWLAALSWRRGSVLALLCGMLGIASAALAGRAAWVGRGATDALAGSLAAITIGAVLLVLGQTVQRLLDQEPDERV
jgi:hypothetical protein